MSELRYIEDSKSFKSSNSLSISGISKLKDKSFILPSNSSLSSQFDEKKSSPIQLNRHVWDVSHYLI